MLPGARSHDAQTPRTGLRRVLGGISLAERLLLTAVAAVLLLAGLANVGSTYAMWVDEAPVDGTSLSTGTAALSAQWVAGEQESAWQNLLPGESAGREVTLENTGTVPLEVTMTLDAAAPGLELRAAPAPFVIEPGQHRSFAVELAATEDLHPGNEIALEVLFEGTQIR